MSGNTYRSHDNTEVLETRHKDDSILKVTRYSIIPIKEGEKEARHPGMSGVSRESTDTLTEEARHPWMIQGCSEYPGNPRIL